MNTPGDITAIALDNLEKEMAQHPAPKSEFCAGGLAEFRFHLHVHAASLIAEVKRHRTAILADKEHVRQVVQLAVTKELWTGAHRAPDPVATSIADRVAEQLVLPVKRLSAEDWATLATIRDEIAFDISDVKDIARAKRRAAVELLDRLLGANR